MPNDIFPQAVAATLKWEGGYADDPADPGGETNFGISKRSYPQLDIANLTREDAIAIYRRDFWDRPGIGSLPDRAASKVFDLGVNMGSRTAVKLLQRACNHFNVHPPLAIDGRVGPLTVDRATAISDVALLQALRGEAENHYISLATEHPQLRKFLRSWLRRAAA